MQSKWRTKISNRAGSRSPSIYNVGTSVFNLRICVRVLKWDISGVPTLLSKVPSLDVVYHLSSHHNYIIRSSTPSGGAFQGAFFLSSLHPTTVPRTQTHCPGFISFEVHVSRVPSVDKDSGWDGWMGLIGTVSVARLPCPQGVRLPNFYFFYYKRWRTTTLFESSASFPSIRQICPLCK